MPSAARHVMVISAIRRYPPRGMVTTRAGTHHRGRAVGGVLPFAQSDNLWCTAHVAGAALRLRFTLGDRSGNLSICRFIGTEDIGLLERELLVCQDPSVS